MYKDEHAMPNMDMNMDGSHGNADYADYEYQTTRVEFKSTDNTGNVALGFLQQIEPLADIGGLDSNEVAELVYLEVQASLEPEPESDSQGVASQAELRGLVGANIERGGGLSNLVNQEGSADIRVFDYGRNNVFQEFVSRGIFPFDNAATGAGGGDVGPVSHYEKHWRQITNRGPVLDANDDISVSASMNVSDTNIDFQGIVSIKMIWDVAETSDAGRQFSVPN